MHRERLSGLNENHERRLLASARYAAQLIRECDEVLAASESPQVLSPYAGGLTPPQRKIARDYLRRLEQQLLRFLEAVDLAPPPPSIDAAWALRTTMTFLDNTLEEMRGRHLRGFGKVSPEAEQVLEGVVSEMQGLVREFDAFLTGGPADVLQDRLQRLPDDHPVAEDVRELARIITDHGLIDLRAALATIADRTLEDTFEVAVVGRVSSGKSTLLNALLGSPVLPTGVLPVTAFPTRLRRGSPAMLQVTHADGRVESCAIDRIGELVTETQNPGNEKRLARLLVELPSDRLPEGVTFVDTPGLGSLASTGALQTFAYLPRCDHATFLLDATAPVAEEDLELLAYLRDASITTSVLLSKADLLTATDLTQVLAYISRQVRARLGADVGVRPVSAMPSHAPLLTTWIDDEVSPLGERARAHARDALVRKVSALRRQATAALERRRAPHGREDAPDIDAHALATRLRDAAARLERTSRDLRDLPERRAGVVDMALAGATDALVDLFRAVGASTPPNTGQDDDVIRAALVRPAQEVGETVARHLAELARETHGALSDAAAALGTGSPSDDTVRVDRDIPLLDLPPVTPALRPPVWARASRALLRRWTAEQVRAACGPVVDAAVAAYLDVLRRWASDGLARARRAFDGESRPLLAQLTTPGAEDVTSGGARAALERDLRWLRGERRHRKGTTASPVSPHR